MKWSVVVLAVAAAVVGATKNDVYQGFKSYYVETANSEQQRQVQEASARYEADILTDPLVGRAGVVLVGPQQQTDFLQELEKLGVKYTVHNEDIKAALDLEDVVNEQSRQNSKNRNGGKSIPYDNYQDWEVIDEYMEDIAQRYPERVTLVHAADSFEGRPIKYLKISTTNFSDLSKPVIFIDGGIHSREWISPPSVAWMIHKLVVDITDVDLAENVDWIIHPIVNPDGYKYTFSNERFWRKTRSTHHTWGTICPGADGNRNYDWAWNTVGTSNVPCSDVFAGANAFSEIETRVVRDIVLEHLGRMPLYITMHSYGSMILYPWGHNSQLPANALLLHAVGVAMAQAMDPLQDPAFPTYVAGNSGLVIGYEAAGASEDWAYSVGVPLSYTIELPGLSGGYEGFHLPPQYIERVVQETWAGVTAGARMAITLYGRK